MKRLLAIIFFVPFLIAAQNTPEEVCPIHVGTDIPQVLVTDLDNKIVELNEICKTKPTVLVFYRGGWCPYCRKHLAALQEAEADILELGYQIIAVSADDFSQLENTIDRKKINYQLFSDSELKAATAFGIAWHVSDKEYNFKKNVYQIDLEKWSKTELHMLPVPAIFIIKNGMIQYEYVNPNYKTRLSPKVLLGILKGMEE